jgi:hypothetical protein
MRNEDHVFEMTKKEFVVWIEELVSRHNCQTKFFEIGDNVNGLRPTLAVIIKANDKKEV